MKKFETFAHWAADQHANQKKMISALRKLVKKTAPVTEGKRETRQTH